MTRKEKKSVELKIVHKQRISSELERKGKNPPKKTASLPKKLSLY
jgi:hypothetical protein